MMRRTPMPRRTVPLRRTPGPAGATLNPGPRRRLPAQSARRRARDKDYPAAREAVYHRAEGRCEAATGDRCVGHVELDVGQAHHIAGRGGTDPHRLDNLLWLCAPCHQWIHGHPAASYAAGWMAHRNGPGDPRG